MLPEVVLYRTKKYFGPGITDSLADGIMHVGQFRVVAQNRPILRRNSKITLLLQNPLNLYHWEMRMAQKSNTYKVSSS